MGELNCVCIQLLDQVNPVVIITGTKTITNIIASTIRYNIIITFTYTCTYTITYTYTVTYNYTIINTSTKQILIVMQVL